MDKKYTLPLILFFGGILGIAYVSSLQKSNIEESKNNVYSVIGILSMIFIIAGGSIAIGRYTTK